MRSGGVTLAPMRTGVGLRAGVNAQYQVYSDRRDWFRCRKTIQPSP